MSLIHGFVTSWLNSRPPRVKCTSDFFLSIQLERFGTSTTDVQSGFSHLHYTCAQFCLGNHLIYIPWYDLGQDNKICRISCHLISGSLQPWYWSFFPSFIHLFFYFNFSFFFLTCSLSLILSFFSFFLSLILSLSLYFYL